MPHDYIRLSKEEFDRLRPVNNQVIIEMILPKDYETRKSGLIMVKDPMLFFSNEPDHAGKINLSAPLDRIGRVTKVPDKIYCKKRYDIDKLGIGEYKKKNAEQEWKMEWETIVEIIPDDIVAFDYHSAYHCPIIQCEDKEYRILNYQNLIVAKRKQRGNFEWKSRNHLHSKFNFSIYKNDGRWIMESIIPLNGYCLFTRKYQLINSTLIIPDSCQHIDKKRGIVKYVGTPVEYFNKQYFDGIEIKEGDEVIFNNESECLLEDSSHFHLFNEEFRYEQRKNIVGIIN